MKDIWNKIKNNKTRSTVIAVLIVILVILTGLFSNGSLNIKNFGLASSDKQTSNTLNSDFVSDFLKGFNEANTALSAENSGVENSFVSVVDGLYYYNKVMIPLLANPELFDYNGQKTGGCGDEIVWVVADLEGPTRAPLTAAINILFSSNDFGFEPGSFLAKQEDLSFDKVVIEDKIAKIYLEGEFTLEDDCDAPRQFIQLEEVAMQFDSVSGVQIYLNNELLR